MSIGRLFAAVCLALAGLALIGLSGFCLVTGWKTLRGDLVDVWPIDLAHESFDCTADKTFADLQKQSAAQEAALIAGGGFARRKAGILTVRIGGHALTFDDVTTLHATKFQAKPFCAVSTVAAVVPAHASGGPAGVVVSAWTYLPKALGKEEDRVQYGAPPMKSILMMRDTYISGADDFVSNGQDTVLLGFATGREPASGGADSGYGVSPYILLVDTRDGSQVMMPFTCGGFAWTDASHFTGGACTAPGPGGQAVPAFTVEGARQADGRWKVVYSNGPDAQAAAGPVPAPLYSVHDRDRSTHAYTEAVRTDASSSRRGI